MTDVWEERKKAIENEYFYKLAKEQIAKLKQTSRDHLARELCHNRCPKCGDAIVAMEFRGVPLDKCQSCGGVWLGPKDLQILAEKDHRTWFDRWFKAGEKEP